MRTAPASEVISNGNVAYGLFWMRTHYLVRTNTVCFLIIASMANILQSLPRCVMKQLQVFVCFTAFSFVFCLTIV